MNWRINNFTVKGIRPSMGWPRALWTLTKVAMIVGVLTWVLGSEVTGGIR